MHRIKNYFCALKITVRDGAVVARWAHNPKVVSSSLAPATKEKGHSNVTFFIFTKNQND